MNKWVALVASILISESAGIIGSIFTIQAIPIWYTSLNKPSFSPPNWLFGPVWTLLYILMGIAAYLVYNREKDSKKVKRALLFFAIQLD